VVVLVIAMPATVQAQCSYRMNDVGRPHGYLSGPCNGAAQGYSGAYPSRQHPGGLRTVRTGNTVQVYNTSGQHTMTVVKNGNVAKGYDARGRYVRKAILGSNGWAIYDTRGRFLCMRGLSSA
jgi:hypothetical protein